MQITLAVFDMGAESFFTEHATLVQVGLFAFLALTLWFCELIVTLQPWKNKWKHSSVNLMFVSTALPIQLGLTVVVLLVSKWVTLHQWGILYLFPMKDGSGLLYVAGFFLLDFFEYLYHRMMHGVSSLWRFHMVHHSDPFVDVSTTVREHPGETAVRVSFLAFVVFVSGAPMELLIIRQTVQTVSNITAHTHLKLSSKMNKMLSWLLITPNLHHVHHHHELPYTDCNYGDVFSIWDRMFGTYSDRHHSKLKYGIDVFEGEQATKFSNLIKVPLNKRHMKKKT